MKRWWTSDLHLGHANICGYANRPWLKQDDLEGGKWLSQDKADECASRMNAGLIRNFNQRVKPGDTVINVGDFCCFGNERGVGGSRKKANEWEKMLNGKWIHVSGNHDGNNGLKFGIEQMIVDIGPIKALVIHVPPTMLAEVPDFCDLVVCGHVHQKWTWSWLEDRKPMLNVGVDVHKWMPISDSELIEMYFRFLKG